MPVERHALSLSMFAELVGIEPASFVGVEVNRLTSTVTLVVEGDSMQGTGTFPQAAGNTKYGGSAKTTKGGGGKKH